MVNQMICVETFYSFFIFNVDALTQKVLVALVLLTGSGVVKAALVALDLLDAFCMNEAAVAFEALVVFWTNEAAVAFDALVVFCMNEAAVAFDALVVFCMNEVAVALLALVVFSSWLNDLVAFEALVLLASNESSASKIEAWKWVFNLMALAVARAKARHLRACNRSSRCCARRRWRCDASRPP